MVLLIASSPPVDTLSDQLLVAHMAEHLLIGDIAALLLVLGMTGPMLAPLLRNRGIAKLRILTHPVVAIVFWAVNFYAWHSPALYQAALRHDAPARARARDVPGLRHLASGWRCSARCPSRPGSTTRARLVYIIAVRLSAPCWPTS